MITIKINILLYFMKTEQRWKLIEQFLGENIFSKWLEDGKLAKYFMMDMLLGY